MEQRPKNKTQILNERRKMNKRNKILNLYQHTKIESLTIL